MKLEKASRQAALFTSLAFASICLNHTAHAVSLGEKLPTVELSGETGGRTDGGTWSSSMIKDKVFFLFYVDPDEKAANEELEAALAKEKFPTDKQASIAVINMDATWLPNAAIASSLAAKQKEFPMVTYVKDLKRVLVKEWKLKDDAYVTLVFDRNGKVIYAKDGTLDAAEIKKMIEVSWKAINAP